MSVRISHRVVRSRRHQLPPARRGVLLLIVMALLALLTLLGLTLVVATSQGRMSAMAAARANAEATRDDAAIDEVINQVLRGTNDPDSPLQGHGLLDDMYGPPQLFGRVGDPTNPGPSDVVALAGGQLLVMRVTQSNGYVLAPYNGAYCGQVITMIDGPAQGYSSRVVGYVYNGTTPPSATIEVLGFSGLVPNPASGAYLGDQFMINGRPFSGTGFGFDLTQCPTLNTNTPVPTALSAPYSVGTTGPLLTVTEASSANVNKPGPTNMPYAFLPNHAQIQLTPTSTPQAPYYYDPAGPGGANEPYDAVDFQNMLLAMHIGYSGTAITPIPSLHRPELVAWYAYQTYLGNLTSSSVPLNIRRKVILRPEPMDQVFTAAQDLNGNGMWDFREPFVDLDGSQSYSAGEAFLDLNGDQAWTAGDLDYSGNQFNPITGCWYIDGSVSPVVWRRDPNVQGGLDVDNDNDGVPDSIWIDAGLPVKTLPDGTQYKNLAAILCIDMDGKINPNAHGTIAQLDPNRYFNTAVSTISGPFAATTTGQMSAEAAAGQRYFPIGQGYGPAEINPAYLLAQLAGVGSGGAITAQTLNYYAYLTMGYAFYDYSTPVPTLKYAIDGKYGESSRAYAGSTYNGLYPPANDNSPMPNPAYSPPGYTFQQYLLGGPRPGWSRWIDPWMTDLTYTNTVLNPGGGSGWDWVNDPVALARMSEVRPYLLSPPLQLQGINYRAGRFFDFIAPTLVPNSLIAPYANPVVHVPTAHGSPYDLNARGVVATDLRGVPYYAGTQTQPWMLTLQDPGLLTPPATSPNPNLQDAYLSYLNDAIDSPYEFDLSPNAQHAGKITGNYGGAGASPGDVPYSPTEMEGLLRVNDPDAADLRKRLDQLETIFQNALSPPTTMPTQTPSSLTNVRLSLTTESWDLPVPSVALTPQQMQDVAAFNTQFAASGPQLNLSGLSLTDLARTRIFAENAAYTVSGGADLALFGNVNTSNPTILSGGGIPVWPLLAPEVVMGLRFDINRPLGNGQDDNGNGVVDEPQEVFWRDAGNNPYAEATVYPTAQYNPVTGRNTVNELLDLNNDGFIPTDSATPALNDPQTGNPPTLSDPTLADMRARQLLARQLYVMMMLMIDDRAVTANIYQTAGAQLPWNSIPANSRAQAAYLVAQWAINAVDFRDRDSIMTPFEFDIYPFVDNDGNVLNGTWDVDDLLTGAGDDLNVVYRGLVWGCERPELLITEGAAFHDRGTDDTNQATNVMPSNTADTFVNQAGQPNPDTDYDQVRRPRGSLVVELYNPTSPTSAPQRDLQYDPNLASQPWNTNAYAQPWMNTNYPGTNQGYGVNLAQVANRPVGMTTGPLSSPVWRLAIVYSPNGYDNFTGLPNTTSYTLDPRAPTLPANRIYRAVYFAPYRIGFRYNAAAGTVNELTEAQSFFADSSVVPLGTFLMVPPGNYALVGPACPEFGNLPTTNTATAYANAIYIGQNYVGQTARAGTAANSYPKQLELGGNLSSTASWTGPVGMWSGATAQAPYVNPPYTDIKPVVGVPIQTNWLDAAYNYVPHQSTDTNPGGLSTTLRMSISEPQYGYPIINPASIADDGFYYSGQGTPVGGLQFPNHPFDSGSNTQVPNPTPYVGDGKTSGYTIVFLQRLANPLIPWDPNFNPYISVDSMPVDLTGYTGENNPLDPMSTTATEPPYGMAGGALAFDTRRRGGTAAGGQAPDSPNVWTPVTWPPFALPASGSLATPLPSHTLGYLNTAEYGPYYSLTNPGSLATINTNTGIPAAQYYGDPAQPFPWLTWLDRPYVSQYELMMVPASSPASLAADFSMLGWQTSYAGTAVNEYLPGQPAAAGQLPVAQFRHLLNFYDSQQPLAPAQIDLTTGLGTGTYAANFYRIFEHVHVPSRFTGTQTMLSPVPFETSNAGAFAHYFHPPFNWVSSYREPGRINLNTSFDGQVFQGLMDAYPGTANLWQQVIDSRQGFNSVGNAVIPNWQALWSPNGSGNAQQAVYPTYFANPFRPDGAGALVPPGAMTTSVTPPASPLALQHPWSYPGMGNYFGANATLLRSKSSYSDPGPAEVFSSNTSLFDDGSFDPYNSTNVTTPLTSAPIDFNAASSTTQYRHASRNAYFQYQALQRLGNLATNRSNVYAVWVTLGKFQVQRVPISPTNPDGFALVNEVGSSTGEIERKRAFYLIDRSIPVGFKRGENMNVERTILVERILDD